MPLRKIISMILLVFFRSSFSLKQSVPVWRELLNDAERRKKYFEIPKKYNFQTIADLLVIRRQQNPKPKHKPSSSKIRQKT